MNSKLIKYFYIFFIVSFLSYLFFNIANFFFFPKIEIYNFPTSTNFLTTNHHIFLLTGKVKGVKDFFISGQKVFLNKELEFEKKIILFEGINKIYLKGITKNDNFIERKIEIFYTKK